MKKLLSIPLVICVVSICGTESRGDANAGKMLYEKMKCAACHGKDLTGNKAMAKVLGLTDPGKLDLTRTASTDKAEDRGKVVAKGKGKMPSYEKKLKADEINAIVDYIRASSKTE